MRLILCVGDAPQTGGYTVNSNTRPFTVSGHPVAVIGGEAFYNACNKMGVIAKAGGPRRIRHTPFEVALDGDVLLCGCAEPPRMVAKMQQTNRHEDMCADGYEFVPSRTVDGGVAYVPAGLFDERLRLPQNARFEGYSYYIETSDGRYFSGRIDSAIEPYSVFWGDDALARKGKRV